MTPSLSVIVCSHNGSRQLPRVLESLAQQTAGSDNWELIVVDDGSQDATAEVAEGRGARVVRLRPNRGLAAARNAGVSAARAPIVAFTDDDCEVDLRWVEALLGAFQADHVDGVGGRVIPAPASSFNTRYVARRNPLSPLGSEFLGSSRLLPRLGRYLLSAVRGATPLAAGDELYSVVGANMAFRRELILRLGGFDEAFRFGGEEEDLCRRANAIGARLRYVPDAVVVHRFEADLMDTFRRSRAYGRGNARLAVKHSDVRLILFPFPFVVLGLFGLACLRRSRIAPGAVLAPLLTYPRWIFDVAACRALEPLAYPYVQMMQELATMVGEIEGWRAGYVSAPSEQLVVDGPDAGFRCRTQ